MEDRVLRTKLQRPRVTPDILPQTRLIDRLDEGRWRTLTLISAPAGYGKSTLASCWVSACNCPVGWVSLDNNDGDLCVFLSYFLAAIRSIFPETELRTEALLEASQLPSVQALARHLLNDLHQTTGSFILVLDDYHHVRGGSPVHDLIREFLIHPLQTMHLVLLARRDPPLPIASLRGRGQLTEIRTGDLRFTPAEAAAFLNKKLKVPMDDATAGLLDQKTEGWVTGLRLAGLYLRNQDDLNRRVQELSGSSRHIAEYLAAEVLSRQDPEIVAYLLETSILQRFCAPLCEAVHSKGFEGQDEDRKVDAQQFIEWLVKSNLFVIPLDDQGYWFRYHHLFQGFLQSLLHKRANSVTVAGLHMLASKWYAENDLIDEAIQHALSAGDIEAAVQLVIAHRYSLMNTAQFHRLKHWLALLPQEAISETPLLACARAFIGIEHGQDSDVYDYTTLAEQMLTRFPSDAAEYAALKNEVHTLKGFIDMAWGHPGRGIAHAEEALDSLPADALLVRSLGILTLALCLQMKGNPSQAAKVLREALFNPAWPANIRARIQFYLAITRYMDADLVGAMSSSRECLDIVRDHLFTHTRTFACYLLGAALYWRNELAEAESQLLSVLDDCHLSNPSYVANSAFILACMYLGRDHAEQAEQVLMRVRSHFQEIGHPVAQAMVQAFQVEFALRQGELKTARQLNKDVDFEMRPPLWFYYVPQLTPIKLLLVEDTDQSLKEAYTRLVELTDRMSQINRKNVLIDVLALLALVCLASGKEAAALKHLESALDLAEPGGWTRNFVDLGAPMWDLLEHLNRVCPGHKYARQVLEACRAEAQSSRSPRPGDKKRSCLSGQFPVQILTQREIELLPLLAEGLNNDQIAEKLSVATVTVKTHLQNIYRKLDAGGRIKALKKARSLGLIKTE